MDLGLQMIDMSLETGWDRDHSGIFYFLDRRGHSPEQLVRPGVWACLAAPAHSVADRFARHVTTKALPKSSSAMP